MPIRYLRIIFVRRSAVVFPIFYFFPFFRFFSFFLSPFSFSYFFLCLSLFSLFFISPFLSSSSSSPSRSLPPSPPPPRSPPRNVAAHDLIFSFYLYYMKFCILFQIIQLLHLLMFFCGERRGKIVY